MRTAKFGLKVKKGKSKKAKVKAEVREPPKLLLYAAATFAPALKKAKEAGSYQLLAGSFCLRLES